MSTGAMGRCFLSKLPKKKLGSVKTRRGCYFQSKTLGQLLEISYTSQQSFFSCLLPKTQVISFLDPHPPHPICQHENRNNIHIIVCIVSYPGHGRNKILKPLSLFKLSPGLIRKFRIVGQGSSTLRDTNLEQQTCSKKSVGFPNNGTKDYSSGRLFTSKELVDLGSKISMGPAFLFKNGMRGVSSPFLQ